MYTHNQHVVQIDQVFTSASRVVNTEIGECFEDFELESAAEAEADADTDAAEAAADDDDVEEFVGERVSSSWQSILSMSSDILVVDIVRLGSSVTSGMALRRPVRPARTNSSSSSLIISSSSVSSSSSCCCC